jgi:hypothetical protein
VNDWRVLNGIISLTVRRTIADLPSKFGMPLSAGTSFTGVVIRMMDALDGFGFTRPFIFPYDELDFLPLRYLG